MKKTVFISSTYTDLKEHRRAVWEVLEGFKVAVRGMENFGARTEAPLVTCLAEVEQSDVYVGIIAFRLGSVDKASNKSFTQLEYERACELGKEILVYFADEQEACFRYADIDVDPQSCARLTEFKKNLRERHTFDKFSTPEDLAEKLKTVFAKHFAPVVEKTGTPESAFEPTLALVRRFRLLPNTVIGREIRVEIVPRPVVFPASRALCQAFNWEYGRTIGVYMRIQKPIAKDMAGFKDIYATGLSADKFLPLVEARKPIDIYARLQFTPDDVRNVPGQFFEESGFYEEEPPEPEEPNSYYIAPEGKATLLFSKTVL